ncbi:MAG: alpha/beta hydrolase [Ignavibacteria bacterium]|nr:alpha/beta hydrolase [Ignavibacteria bacterium]MBT8391874.1 alpha/beta hydrolase [Ignavibacteria bacterium]NNJ52971.1 alpha/beta hydrolase [Ignavibacteriaceae bacterium]NNL21446.1 alpha/beta hydrolase [Ignavibacteriaceae bacterium]
MKRLIILLFLLSLSFFINNCSASISLGIQSFNVTQDNGDSLTFYLGSKEKGFSNKLLVMIQGSGNESIKKRFGWGVEAATLGYDILYLEKYAFEDSLLFIKSDCRERRLKDIQFALNYIENNVYKNNLEEMFLFADSEGGALVPELAQNNNLIKRAVILATGGYEQSKQFEVLFEKEKKENYVGFLISSGINSKEDLQSRYSDIRSNPSKDKFWLGHSYYYWNSYLWYNPNKIIEKLEIPILHIIGERDSSVPVESVEYLKEKFRNKTNLQFRIIPDLDHSFVDSKGNKQFNKVLIEIILPWYKGTI